MIDDDFSTLPSLRAGAIPDNWHQLVCNSREKSTAGCYDVTKTWLSAKYDITGDSSTNAANQAIESVDIGPDRNATNQANKSDNSCPDRNASNYLQAKESVGSCPDRPAAQAIESDDNCPERNAIQAIESDGSCPERNATQAIESDDNCPDNNATTYQDEEYVDASPEHSSVGVNPELTSNFDSQMPTILNLQKAGLRISPRIST